VAAAYFCTFIHGIRSIVEAGQLITCIQSTTCNPIMAPYSVSRLEVLVENVMLGLKTSGSLYL
jgi:hypothetical protein